MEKRMQHRRRNCVRTKISLCHIENSGIQERNKQIYRLKLCVCMRSKYQNLAQCNSVHLFLMPFAIILQITSVWMQQQFQCFAGTLHTQCHLYLWEATVRHMQMQSLVTIIEMTVSILVLLEHCLLNKTISGCKIIYTQKTGAYFVFNICMRRKWKKNDFPDTIIIICRKNWNSISIKIDIPLRCNQLHCTRVIMNGRFSSHLELTLCAA